MKTGISTETFMRANAGEELAVQAFIDANEALGDRKREKFDVVADQIFPPGPPLPILDIADWSAVKASYAGRTSPFGMLLMLAYRKRFVDATLGGLYRLYPKTPIVAKAVGSTDLTSDYDITLGATAGDISGVELDVIEQFNTAIRTAFGKQAGTVFDTNLYAKDFLCR